MQATSDVAPKDDETIIFESAVKLYTMVSSDIGSKDKWGLDHAVESGVGHFART